MIKDKIDKVLLNLVETQTEGKKIDCIIRAYDYQRLKRILHNRDIKITSEYPFINSIYAKVNKKELALLSTFSQVKFISALSHASALMNVARKILGVNNIHSGGEGVGIAFIDTGIVKHGDFCMGKNRIIYFKDFVSDKKECYDDNGHGTFVAGVCSGNGALSAGHYSGIAPKSNIISLKALNGLGEASADRILGAMEWVYNNHRNYNIRVVCMSFGSDPLGYNDPIMNGAEALWGAGVVVVAAAGNSGPESQTIKSPGVSSQIITVGGFNDNRIDEENAEKNFFEMADFSSRGPPLARFKPDLIAPAVDIISCGREKPYVILSGTSVATPMVAGLSSLIIERQPKISPIEVKRRLLSCATPICFNRNFEGYGYPELNKLLRG